MKYDVKVLAVQHPHGNPPDIKVFNAKRYSDADFICFPEYFMDIRSDDAHAYLKKLSQNVRALVLGTLIEPHKKKRRNITYLYTRGRIVGHYTKISPTERERRIGIVPGKGLKTFHWKGVKFCILICNDVLKGIRPDKGEPTFNPAVFKKLRKLGTKIVFVPLISPLRRKDTPRKVLERRSTLGKMAKLSNAYLIKVGGVGKILWEPVKGRSGAYDPNGKLIAQAKSESKPEIVVVKITP